MEELFMRKSWHVVTRLGRIDAVIFVGDMLDQGRAIMSEEEYVFFAALAVICPCAAGMCD